METEDIRYAAKIHNEEITQLLLRARDNLWKNQKEKTQNKNLLCFVELTTENFRGRAAHYGNPQVNISEYEDLGRVNDIDLDQLRTEIIKDTAVPNILRESVMKMLPSSTN